MTCKGFVQVGKISDFVSLTKLGGVIAERFRSESPLFNEVEGRRSKVEQRMKIPLFAFAFFLRLTKTRNRKK